MHILGFAQTLVHILGFTQGLVHILGSGQTLVHILGGFSHLGFRHRPLTLCCLLYNEKPGLRDLSVKWPTVKSAGMGSSSGSGVFTGTFSSRQ